MNSSRDAAKERLHLVLMQDRANVSADFLELMKQEIIDVIKKYIDVDENEIDVRLTNKENSDGTNGAPALYANIPIVNIKNETRKIGNTNSIENKEDKENNNKENKDENNNTDKTNKEKTQKKEEIKKEIKRDVENKKEINLKNENGLKKDKDENISKNIKDIEKKEKLNRNKKDDSQKIKDDILKRASMKETLEENIKSKNR